MTLLADRRTLASSTQIRRAKLSISSVAWFSVYYGESMFRPLLRRSHTSAFDFQDLLHIQSPLCQLHIVNFSSCFGWSDLNVRVYLFRTLLYFSLSLHQFVMSLPLEFGPVHVVQELDSLYLCLLKKSFLMTLSICFNRLVNGVHFQVSKEILWWMSLCLSLLKRELWTVIFQIVRKLIRYWKWT